MEAAPDAVVLVLLRKAAGGAKGILRSVEGFRSAPLPLERMVDFRPAAVAKVTTHADLNLPFNLSLTEQQREARGAVPLPYAHEGEGADLGMGMDWSDDEEDEEI
jgi:elongator complex protein 5